jgi:Tol biopolymer transport system component
VDRLARSGWGCYLKSAVAGALLLWGMRLSPGRAAFRRRGLALLPIALLGLIPSNAAAQESPSGMIVFQDRFKVYSIHADGTNRQLLRRKKGAFTCCAQWSSDGKKILFGHFYDDTGESGSLHTMKADGTGVRTIASRKEFPDFSGPVWSPTRNVVIFRMGGRLYRARADGTKRRVISPKGWYVSSCCGDPVAHWSPDGSYLAFGLTKGNRYRIYVSKGTLSTTRPVTPRSLKSTDPAWSPDGSRIAFTVFTSETGSLYAMNPDGSGKTRVSPDHYYVDTYRWSPDSDRLAYDACCVDTENELMALYITTADPERPEQVLAETSQEGLDYIALVDWHPSGNELIVSSTVWAEDSFEVVESALKAIDAVTKEERLLFDDEERAGFSVDEWSPDKRFMLLCVMGAAEPNLVTLDVNEATSSLLTRGCYSDWTS